VSKASDTGQEVIVVPQRWQRFLPDLSQLLLVAGVLVVIFAMVSFVNLAIAKSRVLAENRMVAGQVREAEERQELLRIALADAQQGRDLWSKAWDYFGMAPRGATVVLPAPARVEGSADRPASPPYWAVWWQRLGLGSVTGP
jgi:hypothetical protein